MNGAPLPAADTRAWEADRDETARGLTPGRTLSTTLTVGTMRGTP